MAHIYSVVSQKCRTTWETWYMIDSSFITTLPDTWGIGEKFLMLPINKWDNDYQQVVLGGITCDSHDYYDSEEHINEVFLPKLTVTPTGHHMSHASAALAARKTKNRYTLVFSYGGLPRSDKWLWRHKTLPHSIVENIIVGYDKNGALVDWVYARTNCSSMLKILGYL